jgi:conjugative transfer pilus assembly protein TraH
MKRTIRLSALSLAITMALVPAKAGFLDDFYTQSGATVNVTPAGIYESGSANVVSGGGLSYRTPNRTFNPFTFSPPSLGLVWIPHRR